MSSKLPSEHVMMVGLFLSWLDAYHWFAIAYSIKVSYPVIRHRRQVNESGRNCSRNSVPWTTQICVLDGNAFSCRWVPWILMSCEHTVSIGKQTKMNTPHANLIQLWPIFRSHFLSFKLVVPEMWSWTQWACVSENHIFCNGNKFILLKLDSCWVAMTWLPGFGMIPSCWKYSLSHVLKKTQIQSSSCNS